MQTDCTEKNGSKGVDVLRVKVIPDLAIAIESAATVNIDVFATQLEKGCGVLVGVVESVLLPVVRVIGELNCSLDIYIFRQRGLIAALIK